MEVVNLEISGFRQYETLTAFDFKNKEKDYIFDADNDAKLFLLDSILGIIFGFDADEKDKFRGDDRINKTFTGVVTLELDARTMMIERDFETNFVACILSDIKTTRSVFQGKDFVGNGYSRPYLQMLKSIFPITDKDIIREICIDDKDKMNGSFEKLLNILYIIFTPQFKFSSTKFLLNENRRILNEYKNYSTTTHAAERLYLQKKTLEHLLKLQKSIDKLSEDYEQLKHLLRNLKKRNSSTQAVSEIDQQYASLAEFNPLQARADILMWKNLNQKKLQHELELKNILERKERIAEIIENELHDYNSLPDSFSKDITRLRNIFGQMDKYTDDLSDQKTEIKTLEIKLNKHNILKRILLALLPPVIFVISYFIFGPFWILIIPESVLAFFIVLFFYGHSNYKLRSKIYRIQEEAHIAEKRMNDFTQEVNDVNTKFPILQDKEYIESHLERFKKFQHYQTELRRQDRDEDNIRKILRSPPLKQQLPHFETTYSNAVDISRPDLEEFLDSYIERHNEISYEKEVVSDDPFVEELGALRNIYIRNIDELKSIWKELSQAISSVNDNEENDISQVLDIVDRKINSIKFENRVSFSA